jgi:hypothetical protein
MVKIIDPSPLPIPNWQSKMLPGRVWGFLNYLKMLVASHEEVCSMQSNQQFVSIAIVFFTLPVAGFGLLLLWQVCRFLGVSISNKLRNIQLLKIFFLAPWPKSHTKF